MLGQVQHLKRDAGVLLFLLGLVLCFFFDMLRGGGVPAYRDLAPYFFPMRYSMAESLKSGALPLWDNHTGMGFPLLADFQSAVFYPPHVLFAILPFFAAVKVLFLFHFAVAVSGSYFLWRRWNYPPYLAATGSVLFTFGGLIVSLTNLLNHFQTAVWLPWAVLFSERMFRSNRCVDFFLCGLVLVFQLLAGSPEIYLMEMVLLLLVGIFPDAANSKRNNSVANILLRLAAVNAAVVAVSMAQILPTAELALQSRGYRFMSLEESSLWSMESLSLLNLFFVDKEVDLELFQGVHLFWIREIPFFLSHYMGTVALYGVALWLYFGSRREKAVCLVLLLVSLLLAVGKHTPLYQLAFRYLPVFGLFRFPEKFFFFAYAVLLWAATRGLHAFLENESRPPGRASLLLFGVFAGFIILYLFCRVETPALVRFLSWASSAPADWTLKSSAGVLFYLERQALVAAGFFLLLVCWRRVRIKPALLAVAFVGLNFADLSVVHRPYLFLLEPALTKREPKLLRNLGIRPGRLFYYPGTSNTHPSHYQLARPADFTEFHDLLFDHLLPNTGAFYGIDYMQELDALHRWPYRVFLAVAAEIPTASLYRLLGALNVEYLVSFQQMPEGEISLLRHFSQYPSWLYRLQRVVPRAYVVGEVEVIRDAVQTLGRLAAEQFDPFRQVILEQPLDVGGEGEFQGGAELVSYANREVTVKAWLSGAGVLVLADSYYPGWRVYVDGEEGEIVRANLFFRGVPLPAGEHVVRFRYEPASFAWGLTFSLAAAVVTGACIILRLRRRVAASTAGL